MWNDLSGVWLDSFRLNFEQQAWLLYLKLLAIREALSTVIRPTTAAQNQAWCNYSGVITLVIMSRRRLEKAVR